MNLRADSLSLSCALNSHQSNPNFNLLLQVALSNVIVRLYSSLAVRSIVASHLAHTRAMLLLLWRSNSLLVAAAQARLPRPPSTLSRRLLLQLRRLQLQLQPRLRQRLPTPRWMSRRSPSHKSTRRRRSILRSRSAARRRSSPSLPRRKATRSTRRTSSTKPSRPTIAPSNSTRARCPSSPTVLVRVLLRVAHRCVISLKRHASLFPSLSRVLSLQLSTSRPASTRNASRTARRRSSLVASTEPRSA